MTSYLHINLYIYTYYICTYQVIAAIVIYSVNSDAISSCSVVDINRLVNKEFKCMSFVRKNVTYVFRSKVVN